MRPFISSFFLLIAFTSFAQNLPNKQKMNYQELGAPIPPFVLEKTMGGVLTNTQLKKDKSVMLMIFNPQCDHCELMVDSLKRIAANFKNTQIIMVAEHSNKDFMKDFISKTGIATLPLFQNIGTERGKFIPYVYTNHILPQINFYNSDYKLIKTFTGNSTLDSIKMFIQ